MCRSKRRAPSLVGVAVALAAGLSFNSPVQAQAASDASKAKPELSPSERAQRDADKVFQWIRFHADKAGAKPAIILPGQGAAAAPAPAPAVAAKPAARTPERNADAGTARRAVAANAPDRRGITETVSDVPAEPARSDAVTAAAAAAPESTQLASASLSATVPAVLPETLVPAAAPAAAVFAEPPPVVETPLKAIKMVEPEFPRQLQSTLRAGTVQVRFTVMPDGSVSRAEAVQSTHRRLSPAALEAVNQWRFEPIAKAREATVELVFRVE